jgi:hypothetical protein
MPGNVADLWQSRHGATRFGILLSVGVGVDVMHFERHV